MQNEVKKLTAIDFFCSGGGMSYGLMLAGIDVIAGIDIDISCKETYEANIPNSKFIHADIKKLKADELKKHVSINICDNNLVFVGCSPCQFWTGMNTNKTNSKKTRNLLKDFERFVNYYKPGYVVVENVPGILTKKEKSGLDKFVKNLESLDYKVGYKIVNLNHYGVPQNRRRFTLIGNKTVNTDIFPQPMAKDFPLVKSFIGKDKGFEPIGAGHYDSTDFMHITSSLSEENLQRIKLTPINGGRRSVWANTDLQIPTYKKMDAGSFSDVYGRMSWDKPAPTITTKFNSISNGCFGHPEENRAISLREGATLQTFPKSFVFKTKGIGDTARIIGNAVPPEFARRIGEILIEANSNGQ